MNIEELQEKLIAGNAEAIEILQGLIYRTDTTKIKIVCKTREECAEIIKNKFDKELSKNDLDIIMDDYDSTWDSLAGDFEDFLDNQDYECLI